MSTALADERYVSIETVRKNGEKKTAPIWIAALDDKLVAITDADSWKVKRIRNNPAVRLAPCDMKGAVSGDYRAGTAELVTGAELDRVNKAIAAKYTWQTWPFKLAALFGRSNRVGLVISLSEGAVPSR